MRGRDEHKATETTEKVPRRFLCFLGLLGYLRLTRRRSRQRLCFPPTRKGLLLKPPNRRTNRNTPSPLPPLPSVHSVHSVFYQETTQINHKRDAHTFGCRMADGALLSSCPPRRRGNFLFGFCDFIPLRRAAGSCRPRFSGKNRCVLADFAARRTFVADASRHGSASEPLASGGARTFHVGQGWPFSRNKSAKPQAGVGKAARSGGGRARSMGGKLSAVSRQLSARIRKRFFSSG